MVYDYLGLGEKKAVNKSDGFLNIHSDYLGLGEFAHKNVKTVSHIRKSVKREIHSTKNAVKEIQSEYKAFRKDVGHGGWLGSYIRRKIKR